MPPSRSTDVVVSRLRDPVDVSSFVDVTADLRLPRADGPCTPQSLEEARERYRRQVELFEGDDYERIRIEIERAYALCPSVKMLYDLAVVERQLTNLARAYALFEAYLAKADPPAERVADVRKRIAEIEPRIGWIAVECGPGVDHVIVDDGDLTALGACPFRRRLRADVGKRRVQTETFTLAPGSTVGFSLRR